MWVSASRLSCVTEGVEWRGSIAVVSFECWVRRIMVSGCQWARGCPCKPPCAESPITIDALSRGFDAETWRIRDESDETHIWQCVLVDPLIFTLYAPWKQSKDGLQY